MTDARDTNRDGQVSSREKAAAQRLYVRYDEGSGPPIVLLHGINSDASDWRPVMDRIGQGYRLIALDLLGFGESPKPLDVQYTAEDHCAAIKTTLDDIGVTEPILLVGYSLGGDIAIKYAAKHPGDLRRLFMLSAPFYLPPSAFESRDFGIEYLKVILFQRVWKLVGNSKKRDTLLYQIANGQAQAFAKQFLRTDDVPTHWDIMSRNLTNTIGRATFVDELPKLSMPTTFALGVRDPIVHPDQTPELKRLKPDMEIRRIIGLTADHFLLVALPEKVADEIMRDEVISLNVRMRKAGGGEHTYVFLHGIEDNPGFWKPAAEALGRVDRTLMIDLMGFGDSEKPVTSHYTLPEHASNVARVIAEETEAGDGPITLVGHGFGGNVALAAAPLLGQRVDRVVAFSPLFLARGSKEGHVPDPEAAEALALRDSVRAMLSEERANVKDVEKHEELIVPFVRTMERAVLQTDVRRTLRHVSTPVTLVMPVDDTRVPRDELEEDIDGMTNFTVVEPPGDRQLPIHDRAATLRIIDPQVTDQQIHLAEQVRPVSPMAGLNALQAQFTSATNSIQWRGVIELLAGLFLLAWPVLPVRLIAIVFGVWMLVEGVQTIAGAVGLQRTGKTGWIPWMLMGVLLGGFAVWMIIVFLGVPDRDAPTWILAIIVAVRALYIAFSDIYVAWRVKRTPTPRWILWAEGILGLLVGLSIIFLPHHGATLLKWVLGGYLTIDGTLNIVYAVAVRRKARKRAEALVRGDGVAQAGKTAAASI